MINASYNELVAPSVTMDDEKGGYLATEHLLKQGHKNILGLFKTDDLQGVNRMKGYIRANREHGIIPAPDLIVHFSTEEKGRPLQEKVKHILQKDSLQKPDAIFCYNDETALSILNVIRELNLKVPDDVSIVGFDDSHLAKASEVKLTTIKHPKMELGETAANLIIQQIEQNAKDGKDHSVIFEPELIVRSSTAPRKEQVL